MYAQNVSLNTNNKNACLHSPTSIFPPLPLMIKTSKESINHLNDSEEMDEKKRKKSQSLPNRNVLTEYLQKSDVKKTSNKQISATK